MLEQSKKLWNVKAPEKKKNSLRKQTFKALGVFFLLIFIFTLLSRAATTFTLAEVMVETPGRRSIDHVVRQEGTIEAGEVRGIFALGGLNIGEVSVAPGSHVEIGTPLLRVEMSHLNEKINDLETQLEIADLNISDMEYNQTLAQEEAATELTRAYEDHNRTIAVANAQVTEAFIAMENARIDLFYSDPESERSLREAFEATQRAYQNALSQRDEEIRVSNRRIDDANREPLQDSTIQVARLERERIDITLSDYLMLRELDGVVVSPMNGTVVSVDASVVVGGITPATAIMQIADTEAGFIFVATINREQQRHVSEGDPVTLEITRGDNVPDLTIDVMARNEQDDEKMDVRVRLPVNDQIRLYDLATMRVEGESRIFSTTIPLSALHREVDGRHFVLVVREEATILGVQMVVDQVFVTIQDRNDRLAAVSDHELGSDQQIVVFSEREVGVGDRVLVSF